MYNGFLGGDYLLEKYVGRVTAESKERYKDIPRKYKIRAGVIWRSYKLSWTDYTQMFEDQKGKCSICSQDIDLIGLGEKGRAASVDHDHVTGKVRGLLCHPCNIGLGGFKDNIVSLERAIQYLAKNYLK